MSNSCCWSALTAGSPEEGSGLSEVLLLEERLCVSLQTGETEAPGPGVRRPSACSMHAQGHQGSPSSYRAAFRQDGNRPAHVQTIQAVQGCTCHGAGRQVPGIPEVSDLLFHVFNGWAGVATVFHLNFMKTINSGLDNSQDTSQEGLVIT